MIWYPVLTYANGTIRPTTPMRPWRRRLHIEAKGRRVRSGARESRSHRADFIRRFRLRLTEAEFQQLEDFVVWAQANWSTSFDFDQGDGTGYQCLLESPAPGQDLEDNASDVPGLVEVELELSKADGSAWTEVTF